LAWQVLYEGHGLVLNGKPHTFFVFGFVMANELRDVGRQVMRVAMQHPLLLKHEGEESSLAFNSREIYERPDLGTLEAEELEIGLE
jgi:hypothetical protein